MKSKSIAAWCLCLTGLTSTAHAEVGLGIRLGPTFGVAGDFNVSLIENRLNARVGYHWLELDYDVEETDATYKGELEIGAFSAMLDWHPFGTGFRLTAGAVSSGPTVGIDGTPAPGTTVEIGDNEYSAAEIGSLRGEIEIGDSVSPYIGIGYGSAVSKDGRVSFLFDLGVIFTGDPNVTLTARCGPAAPQGSARCNQIQQDVNAEIEALKEDAKDFELYPVINIGIGIRF